MKKILIIQQKMIGDVLLTSILFEFFKKKEENVHMTYLANSNTLPVIQNNPHIDRIIEFTKEHQADKKQLFKLIKNIRKNKYDVIIDSYGKLESNLISLFSSAPKRISFYKTYTKWIYTHTVKGRPMVYTTAGNALEDRLRLVLPENEIANNIIAPKIYLTDTEKENAMKFLESQDISFSKPLIMIGILGSSGAKSLPDTYMAKILDFIVSFTKADILFNYAPSQREHAKKIMLLTQPKTQESIHFDIYKKDMREFLGVLSHCSFLIGNEGGAINMAKALKIRTFTIFSPWIKKEVWNMFEDGIFHKSVHLIDVKPEIYKDKIPKEFKSESEELYQLLVPEVIIPVLETYLKNHL